MAFYPKITGNSTSSNNRIFYDLFDNTAVSTTGVNGAFNHSSIAGNELNASVHKIRLRSAAGNEIIYALIIIKNDSTSSANVLDISSVDLIHSLGAIVDGVLPYNPSLQAGGTPVSTTSGDAFSIKQNELNTNGGVDLGNPFIGFQDQTSFAITTSYSHIKESGSPIAITTNPFLQALDTTDGVASGTNRGVLVEVSSNGHVTASSAQENGVANGNLTSPADNVKVVPVYTITELLANNIPGGSYAGLLVKCDGEQASAEKQSQSSNYFLRINHNGIDSDQGGTSHVKFKFEPANEIILGVKYIDGDFLADRALLRTVNDSVRAMGSITQTDLSFGNFNGNAFRALFKDNITDEQVASNVPGASTVSEAEAREYYSNASFREFYRGGSKFVPITEGDQISVGNLELNSESSFDAYQVFAAENVFINDRSTLTEPFALIASIAATSANDITVVGNGAAHNDVAGYISYLNDSSWHNATLNVVDGGQATLDFSMSPAYLHESTSDRGPNITCYSTKTLDQLTKYVNFEATITGENSGETKSITNFVPHVVYPIQTVPQETEDKLQKLVNTNATVLTKAAANNNKRWRGDQLYDLDNSGNNTPIIRFPSPERDTINDPVSKPKFHFAIDINGFSASSQLDVHGFKTSQIGAFANAFQAWALGSVGFNGPEYSSTIAHVQTNGNTGQANNNTGTNSVDAAPDWTAGSTLTYSLKSERIEASRAPVSSGTPFLSNSNENQEWSDIILGDNLYPGIFTTNETFTLGHYPVNYGQGIIPDYYSGTGSVTFKAGFLAVPPLTKIKDITNVDADTGDTFGAPINATHGYNFLNYTGQYISWDHETKGIATSHAEYTNLATSSNPNDGVFDWKLDGTFKANSPNAAADGTGQCNYTASSGIVEIRDFRGSEALITCTLEGTQTQILSCAATAKIVVGQRLTLLSDPPLFETADVTADHVFVREIVTGTEGINVTKFKINVDTKAGVASGQTRDVTFHTDWITEGMRVEGTAAEVNSISGGIPTDKRYYLGSTAQGSSSGAYVIGTDKRFQLKEKINGVLTNVTGQGVDASNQIWKFSKPEVSASSAKVLYCDDYSINSVPAGDLKSGDYFKITAAGGTQADSSTYDFNDFSTAPNNTNTASATIFQATGSGAADFADTATVEIVSDVAGPKEAVIAISGNRLTAKRNKAGYFNLTSNSMGDLFSYEMKTSDLNTSGTGSSFGGVVNTYEKDFAINIVNAGEENSYIKKLEWIECSHVPCEVFAQDSLRIPSDTTKAAAFGGIDPEWTLAESSDDVALSRTATNTKETLIPHNSLMETGTYLLSSAETAALYVSRDSDSPTTYFGRVQLPVANSQGTFYKTLKVTHFRRRGCTDKFYSSATDSFTEKELKFREEWHSYIQFAIDIDTAATLDLTDADGISISPSEEIVFDPIAV